MTFTREFRFALRAALRRPWLTASMVGLLGATLSVNVTLYSALHLLVLRDIPVEDPSTLVVVEAESGRPVSQALLDEIRESTAFSSVGAVVAGSESSIDHGLFIAKATPEFARTLGVNPVRGTWLNEDAPEGVVVAWHVWHTRFGGSPDVIGRSVELGGIRRILLGVMPEGFDFPLGSNMWELAPRASGANYSRFASLTAIARVREPREPRPAHDVGPWSLVPIAERYTPESPRSLMLLLTGASLVFGLTLLHLTAFGLTQLTRLRADAAIRLALGAGHRHLLRQTVADGSILVAGGILLALTLTPALQAAAGRWLPPEVLRGSALVLDWNTFVAALSLSGLVLVLISSIRIPSVFWQNPKKISLTSPNATPAKQWVGRVVLTLQTACAVILLYWGALTASGLHAILNIDHGFHPSRLFAVQLPWGTTPLEVQRGLLSRVDQSVAELRHTPGVLAAAPTMAYPYSRFRGATVVTLSDGSTSSVELLHVDRGYFDTIGARIRSGRVFSEIDVAPLPLRAVINQSLAAALTRDAVLPSRVTIGGLPHEIIGVVDDVRMWRPETAPGFQAYVSMSQRKAPASAIVVRGAIDTLTTATLSNAIQTMWPEGAVRTVSVPGLIERLTAPQRSRVMLMLGLAVSGLLLTLGGLAGLLVEDVRSRHRELAVRIALGAGTNRIIISVVREALGTVGAGLILGLVAGAASASWFGDILPAQGSIDPTAVIMVASIFVAVAFVGSARAALIACRVSPADALRAE